jgi:Beta-lactamase
MRLPRKALPDTDRGALLAAMTANAGRHGAAAVAFFTADAGPSVHCRGYADHQTRVPATAFTRFELGSVTKTFTALLDVLVAEGTITLDGHLVLALIAFLYGLGLLAVRRGGWGSPASPARTVATSVRVART